MMKMCLVGFLKTFLVKMKTGNNQKMKTINSRFQCVQLRTKILFRITCFKNFNLLKMKTIFKKLKQKIKMQIKHNFNFFFYFDYGFWRSRVCSCCCLCSKIDQLENWLDYKFDFHLSYISSCVLSGFVKIVPIAASYPIPILQRKIKLVFMS